jgi:hypothetical protein
VFSDSYFAPSYFADSYFPSEAVVALGTPAYFPDYFGDSYFADSYFPAADVVSSLGTPQYFPHAYFGESYFADSYFPGDSPVLVVIPPVDEDLVAAADRRPRHRVRVLTGDGWVWLPAITIDGVGHVVPVHHGDGRLTLHPIDLSALGHVDGQRIGTALAALPLFRLESDGRLVRVVRPKKSRRSDEDEENALLESMN